MTKLNIKKPTARKDGRLAIRVTAKEKFALELLAQKKGMNLSTLFMEIAKPALKEGLTIKKVIGRESGEIYIPDEVFDPLPPDRLVKLAMLRPYLLSDHDQIIWTVIQENPEFWAGEKPNFKKIRESWNTIEDQANELIQKFQD